MPVLFGRDCGEWRNSATELKHTARRHSLKCVHDHNSRSFVTTDTAITLRGCGSVMRARPTDDTHCTVHGHDGLWPICLPANIIITCFPIPVSSSPVVGYTGVPAAAAVCLAHPNRTTQATPIHCAHWEAIYNQITHSKRRRRRSLGTLQLFRTHKSKVTTAAAGPG